MVEDDVSIRSLAAKDESGLEQLFEANRPTFSDSDIRVGLEVVRDTLAAGPATPDPYLALVAERARQIVGFASYGQVPLTLGTYDLYWIVVHPRIQRAGIGTRLLAAVELDIAARGGRQLLIETSGRADYEPARGLYLRTGCHEIARIPDFYRPGEDRVLYRKVLRPSSAPIG